MERVRPKKFLGQHFLIDQNIAANIAGAISPGDTGIVLEIGPGMGILTRHLLKRTDLQLWAVEVDNESVEYIKKNIPLPVERLIHADFLKMDLSRYFTTKFQIIGNFPYNISSQIFFKVLANRNMVPELVGMVQREVAQRMISAPGTKEYGILAILLQTFYDIEILFPVSEKVFQPPPKVKSAVIRMRRNQRESLPFDESLFFRLVKTAFNQRRKTLANALKPLIDFKSLPIEAQGFAGKRAEQLSISNFIELGLMVGKLLPATKPVEN